MSQKKIIILPILYRDCEIPLFLADRKYADFRTDYNFGFTKLAKVFGIKQTQTISLENWRLFVNQKDSLWKSYKLKEFENLVTTLINRAIEYKWSGYVGGTSNPFSISFYVFHNKISRYVSFKLKGRRNIYYASLVESHNPNRLNAEDYNLLVGNSVNACDEFLWRHMEDFKKLYGMPIYEPYYNTYRFSRKGDLEKVTSYVVNHFNWYKGEKKIKSN